MSEKDIASHAGNWSYNQSSIGIKHEGYSNNSAWFTDTMFRSSGSLLRTWQINTKSR